MSAISRRESLTVADALTMMRPDERLTPEQLAAVMPLVRKAMPARGERLYDVDGRELLWIYAIQAGGYGGDIKLGISRDPITRLRTLQVGHSEELRGVGAWPGTVEDEKRLHAMYSAARLRGEWFMHSLPLWRLVRDLGGGFRWER